MAQNTQSVPMKQQIEARAYELYQARGCQDGYALDDWYLAENELLNDTQMRNEPRDFSTLEKTQTMVPMPVKNQPGLFVSLLSEARQNTALSAKIYKEISLQAQDLDIKEALESRGWIVEKDLSAIDRCFELMHEHPVRLSGHLQESSLEDFRKELREIETPAAKAIFILTKIDHINHARVAEYEGLVEAADLSGQYGVGVLLESCLADKPCLLNERDGSSDLAATNAR